MTRDDAIDVARNRIGLETGAGAFVDLFHELGILKLDEPRNLEQRILEALTGACVGAGLRQPLEKSDVYLIMGWLQSSRLKIVEE